VAILNKFRKVLLLGVMIGSKSTAAYSKDSLKEFCLKHMQLQDDAAETLQAIKDTLALDGDTCAVLGQNAGVQTLNLDGRRLRDLSPLPYFSQLTTLSLRKNELESIAPLRHLTQLQLLDITDNRIHDLSPLRRLTRLKIIKAQGNRFYDTSVLDTLPLEAVYLSTDQVCEQERQWALKQGEIDETELLSFRRSNFGPIYVIPGKRESGIARFLFCGAVASSF
jgi:hypothetical protein